MARTNRTKNPQPRQVPQSKPAAVVTTPHQASLDTTSPSSEPQSDLIGYPQLAEILGISTLAARTAKSRGHLPPGVKIPGVGLRWRRKDVEKWLAEKFDAASNQKAE